MPKGFEGSIRPSTKGAIEEDEKGSVFEPARRLPESYAEKDNA